MQIRKLADKSELRDNGMQEADALQADPTPWTLARVEMLNAPAKQNFSIGFMEQSLKDKVLAMSGDRVIFNSRPPVIYKILRRPGRYCCHCGQKLEDDDIGSLARIHLLAMHTDKASPDRENPSGYRRDSFFACEKEIN